MKLKFLSLSCICGLVILLAEDAPAQIVKGPNASINVMRTNGILVVTIGSNGLFYMNDYFLTDMNANDTVYVCNIKPGKYAVKISTDSASYSQELLVKKGNVQEIRPNADSLNFTVTKLSWTKAIKGIRHKY